MKRTITILLIFSSLIVVNGQSGSNLNADGSEDIRTTPAVSFLTVAPDARHSAMGDVGAATKPDAYAMYWNPGKLVFAEADYAGTISYVPWLRHLVNDMWIGYLGGYMKLNKESAIGVSMQYFNMGQMEFRDDANTILGDHRPKEMALGVNYSRKLSDNLGLAVGAKYISSNLSGGISTGNVTTKPARTAAVDVGAYWQNELRTASRMYDLAVGLSISNLGGSISYTTENNAQSLPTNLRLGANIGTDIDLYNTVNFSLDFNKVLPFETPSVGSYVEDILISSGAEYWYADAIAVRAGYRYANNNYGNISYATLGFGLKVKSTMDFDFSYLIPTKGNSPLQNTIRLSIVYYVSKGGLESVQE